MASCSHPFPTTELAGHQGISTDKRGQPDDTQVNPTTYLHLWKNNVDLGISGPYGNITDGSGAWSLLGNYGAEDVGVWQLQAVIGGAGSAEMSAPILARMAN